MASTSLLTTSVSPEPLPAIIDRAAWPVHVTLTGNATIEDRAFDSVERIVLGTSHGLGAVDVELGPADRFGVRGDVPVLLADHADFHRAHAEIAAGLRPLAGFAPSVPEFWGDGYRPHAAVVPASPMRQGSVVRFRYLHLVVIEGATARPLLTVPLAD